MYRRKLFQLVIALIIAFTVACGIISTPQLTPTFPSKFPTPTFPSKLPTPTFPSKLPTPTILEFDNIFPSEGPTPQSTVLPSVPPATFVETKVTNADGITVFEDVPSSVSLNVQVQDNESKAPLQAIQVQVLSNGNEFVVIALDPAREYLPAWKVVQPNSSRADDTHADIGVPSVHAQGELAVALFLAKVINWLNTGKSAITQCATLFFEPKKRPKSGSSGRRFGLSA